jgi:hypothetical protein
MKSEPDRVDQRRIVMRIPVAIFWAAVIGSAMTALALFGLSYPARESTAIGILGGMGAAIYILYFL